MTLVSRILGSLAGLPPATGPVSVERDLRATMKDGVILLADRWHPLPTSARDAPVILLRTPYGRRQWAGMIGRLFAERGYQVVIQSCRGTFGSGGEWVPFRNEKAEGRQRSGEPRLVHDPVQSGVPIGISFLKGTHSPPDPKVPRQLWMTTW